MALIKCPECSRDVSDKASFCPNCGHPMTSNLIISTDRNNPIQAEPFIVSKRWKKAKLISWAAIIIGLFVMSNSGGSWNSNNIQFWFGFAMMGYGFIALIISKIGAWYNDRSSR